MTEPIDVDSLPPTQYLILDVLAARHRTGEPFWTFPARLRPHLKALTELGLVDWESGPEYGWVRAELTESGRAAVLLDGYEPVKPRHAAAVLSWDHQEQPDLDHLGKLVRDMTGGDLCLRSIDTGSDQYAVVLSTPPLDAAAALEAFRRWWQGGDGLGDIFPVDPYAEQVAEILAGADERRNPNPRPDAPDRLRAKIAELRDQVAADVSHSGEPSTST